MLIANRELDKRVQICCDSFDCEFELYQVNDGEDNCLFPVFESNEHPLSQKITHWAFYLFSSGKRPWFYACQITPDITDQALADEIKKAIDGLRERLSGLPVMD